MNTEIKVSNLDHLEIVAGIIDEIGIVEEVNTRIGRSSIEILQTFEGFNINGHVEWEK